MGVSRSAAIAIAVVLIVPAAMAGTIEFWPRLPIAEFAPPALSVRICDLQTPARFVYRETPALRARAEAGEAGAQFALALALSRESAGSDVLEWIERAARGGHPEAQNEMGFAHRDGTLGAVRDLAAARRWFERSAEGGDPAGFYNLGLMYRDAVGVERDDERASAHFLASANRCYAPGQYAAAFRLQEGVGIARDEDAAETFFLASRTTPNLVGNYMMDLLGGAEDRSALFSGPLASRLPDLWTELHVAKAAYEAAGAVEIWGDAPGGGTFGVRDAFHLDRMAAQIGYRPAQQRLAARYRDGLGVEPDIEEATYWEQRAAANPIPIDVPPIRPRGER